MSSKKPSEITSQSKPKFLEGVTVKITTIGAVLLVVVSTVWTESRHRATIERDVADLKQELTKANKQLVDLQEDLSKYAPAKWDKANMVQWVRETRSRNSDWEPAPIVYRHEDGTITVINFHEP